MESRWELWIKTLTLVGALIAGIWTAVTYLDAKEQEFYAHFWNEKMSLYQRTSNAAATMAVASSLDEFNNARRAYWKLFYGELSLVEGPCVKRAMEVYSRLVPKEDLADQQLLPYQILEQPSYRLSLRLQNELADAWEQPFSELKRERLPADCNFDEEDQSYSK